MPATATDRLSGLTTSVAVKAPVKAVSTANLTLSGLQTVGGVALAEGDRVLVRAQTDAVENGVYVASALRWARAKDFDGALDVVGGTLIIANYDNAAVVYRVVTNDPIRIGTTPLVIAAVSDPTLEPDLNVLQFGAVADGVTDDTAAIQAAIDAAQARANAAVIVPEGQYRITGAITIHQGVAIIGRGSQGSTPAYGCTFIHDADGDCFVWDGNGASAAGTGGGLRNCLILKENGKTGGRAIYVYATDDNHRPGEMVFSNVLIYGRGSGTWEHAIEVDGRNADTPGTRGVRTIHFNKIRVADCSEAKKYIWLRQATHIYGDVQVDVGNGATPSGVTIDDIWDNINLTGRLAAVDVNYTGSDNPQMFLGGRINDLDINDSRVIGNVVAAIYGTLTNASPFLRISSNAGEAFFAHRTSADDGVTGDGTQYTVVYSAKIFDVGGSMDAGTGIFTAKSAGLYQFDYAVTLALLSNDNTGAILNLLQQVSDGSLVNSIDVHGGDVGNMRDAGNSLTLRNSVLLRLSEGDTVRVRLTVSGSSSKNVRVAGSSATRYTYFMGKLLA